ncbi:alcohol dehydrogenase 2-like [Rosa chinensis]|uniref:alcohol dehydrogenase 2-like n=1 Tax=Rosa chinensis TaxID=74649 RepID=UPI001AD8BBDA|nr:alcohol dehydrogenase 2-like [Rosa chinensis]
MASGGIGTFAIQIARHQGVTVFVTAGDGAKLKACRDLGAELCINHNTEDFAELVMQKTEGIGRARPRLGRLKDVWSKLGLLSRSEELVGVMGYYALRSAVVGSMAKSLRHTTLAFTAATTAQRYQNAVTLASCLRV